MMDEVEKLKLIARARRRKAEAMNAGAEQEISQNAPQPVETQTNALQQEMADRQPVAPPAGSQFNDPYGMVKPLDQSLGDAIEPYKVMAGSVWNAAKNTATSLAAGSEAINKGIEGIENPIVKSVASTVNRALNPAGSFLPQGTAQAIDENIPSVTPRPGTLETVALPMGEIAAGMVGPGKFIKTAETIGIPRIFANIAKYMAVNAGGIAAVDPDVRPMFTGENAEIVDLAGKMALDNEGNFSEQLLKNKLNMLAEAMVLAKPSEWALRGTAGVVKGLKSITVDPLLNWKSLDVKKQQAAKDIITELIDIHPDDTVEIIKQKKLNLAKKIRDGADVKVQSDIPGVDDVNIQRPTMNAMIEGGATPQETARAAGVQASAVAKGAPMTEAAQAKPSLELDRVSNQTREAFGGKNSAEEARKGVLQSADQDVKNYDSEVLRKETELNTTRKDTTDLVKDDSLIGSEVSKASEGNQFDLRSRVNNTADELVDKHNINKKEVINESDENFTAIDNTTPADMESFNSVRESADEYLPSDIKKLIDSADGSYGYLKKKVLPELSAEINDLYNSGKGRIAGKLVALRDNIRNHQMEYLTARREPTGKFKKSSPETQVAAQKADKFFKEEVAPMKQGTSDELTDIAKQSKFDYKTGKALKEDEYRVKSRAALKSTLNDPDKAEYTKRVLEIANDPKLAEDYVLGNFAERIADDVAQNGVDSVNVPTIAKSLRDYIPVLGDKGSKKVQTFLTKLESKKMKVSEMTKELDVIREEAKTAKDQIQKKELSNFLDKQGLQNLDPDDVFTKFLSDQDGANQMKQLINRVQSTDNPVAMDGLKSTYANYIKNHVFRGGTDAAGAKNINQTVVKNTREGRDRLIEYGNMIHGKDSTVMKMYTTLLNEADKTAGMKGAVKIPLSPVNANDVQARGAIDFAITQVFGQLNRWGSRLRSVAGRTISSRSSVKQTIDAIDFVNANPKAAAKLIEDIAEQEGSQMNKENKRRVYQFLVLNGLIDNESMPEDLDDQTENALKK
jgi:hypothetical protein